MADTKEPTAPDETKAEPKASKKGNSPVLCGHENKHYVAPKGLEGTRLFCTLPKDHTGDHQSAYQILVDDHLKDSVAYWSDAAGEPIPQE